MNMDSLRNMPSIPPLRQHTPYSYYHADAKMDISQHNRFVHSTGNISMPLYPSHMSQSVPARAMYHQSDAHNSPAPYSQIYHSGYTSTAQSDQASQNAFSKVNLMIPNMSSNLIIEPKLSDSDMYYYPSTPPLSASASVIGSPPDFNGISTPIHPAYFSVSHIKDDVLAEGAAQREWVGCGSPSTTPST